jgi:hypothetical protein
MSDEEMDALSDSDSEASELAESDILYLEDDVCESDEESDVNMCHCGSEASTDGSSPGFGPQRCCWAELHEEACLFDLAQGAARAVRWADLADSEDEAHPAEEDFLCDLVQGAAKTLRWADLADSEDEADALAKAPADLVELQLSERARQLAPGTTLRADLLDSDC